MIYEDKEKICKNPLASAYIFTYNQQELVKETVNSYLAQECDFDFEIVICNDCSKDNTLQTCLEFQKQYPEKIRVVDNEQNMGIRGNYLTNVGKYARGKYVATCAGDDWWSDTRKLAKQVGYMEAHPECDLVHTKAAIYVDKDKAYSKRQLGLNRNTFEESVLLNGVAALTICFTKSSFDEFVQDVNPISLPFSEDYPMVLWYSYKKKIHFIDEATCTYRLMTNSLSHTPDKNKIYKGPQDAYDCKMIFINKFGITDEDLIKKVTLTYYFDRMRYGHLLGDKENIKKGESYFKEKHCYHYYLLSKLYGLAGKNEKANKVVFYFGILLRKVYPIYK